MSDSTDLPNRMDEALRSELRALRRELDSGFDRLSAGIAEIKEDRRTLEDRIRALELEQARARGFALAVASIGSLAGAGLGAVGSWILGK